MSIRMRTLILPLLVALSSTLFNVNDARSSETHSESPQEHHYTYTVKEKGEFLGLIALRLYGRASLWRQIAQWNQLQDPNFILLGQELVLKAAPTKSEEEGELLVQNFWRKRKGLPLQSVAVTDEPVIETEFQVQDAQQVTADVQEQAEYQGATAEAQAQPEQQELTADAHEQAVPAEVPAQEVSPEVIAQQKKIEKQVVVTRSLFEENQPVKALEQMNKLMTAFDPAAERSPASALQAVMAEEETTSGVAAAEPKAQAEIKTFDVDPNLMWFEGPSADILYQAMNRVDTIPAAVDFEKTAPSQITISQCERKVGRDAICARVPLRTPAGTEYLRADGGELMFQTKCAALARQ